MFTGDLIVGLFRTFKEFLAELSPERGIDFHCFSGSASSNLDQSASLGDRSAIDPARPEIGVEKLDFFPFGNGRADQPTHRPTGTVILVVGSESAVKPFGFFFLRMSKVWGRVIHCAAL